MQQIIVYILAFFAIIIGLWLFFGIASILLAFVSLLVAKAARTGKNANESHLALIGAVLFSVALSSSIFWGSGFLRVFSSIFIEFPQSDEVFTTNLLNASVNFGVDVCIGLFAGIVGWRWFPPIIAATILPIFYLLSELTVSITVTPEFQALISTSNIDYSFTRWFDRILETFRLMASPSEWGVSFKNMLYNGGGSILVFKPFFSIGIFLFAFFEVIAGVSKSGMKSSHVNQSAVHTAAISLGIFIAASLMFFAVGTGAIVLEDLPVLLGVLAVLLQIVSFPIFIFAFILFVISAVGIFPFSFKKALMDNLGND